MLRKDFFDRDAVEVAKDLLGCIIRRRFEGEWLSARIIDTEAYYIQEKGSHASLGRTPSREALFMPAGTIYMYYARGRSSLNVSCRGEGNAVLIKSAYPWFDDISPEVTLQRMQSFYPLQKSGKPRPIEKLCSGQTLLCQALQLFVPDWNKKEFQADEFYFENKAQSIGKILERKRCGIPKGRDEGLLLRFTEAEYEKAATKCSV
jgi:DNA-3-methyladenine glycosylase